jgi:soluble lytic murein transglycosylase
LCCAILAGLLCFLSGIAASASTASQIKSRKKPVPLKPAPAKPTGRAALLAVAQHELDQDHLQAAADYALSASKQATLLDDYAQFVRTQAEYRLNNFDEVSRSATRIFEHVPVSPLVGPAAAVAVRAELDGSRPKEALDLVKRYYDRIPQPQADLLLARSFDGSADALQAAKYYQRVYYNYPVAKEATDAANALVDLKARLGESYPPPTPDGMLTRGERLIAAKDYAGARIEYTAAIPQLGGTERDLARVRLGEVDYLSGRTNVAFDYFSSLKLDESEADAERLSYQIRCARKLDRRADVKALLDHLQQQHPASLWRLDALIFVADQARVENDRDTYLPLYRACAADFPQDPRSAWCHWRVAYQSYITDAADTYDQLRKHIEQYPASEDVNNSLYFLGRWEERKNALPVARACYEQLILRFPNTYFALVARQRLKDPGMQNAISDPATLEWLRSVSWKPREGFPSFTPAEAVQVRIERAQLLQMAGLDDLAEGELRFGARNDGLQHNVYAYELARFAAQRNAPDQGMRYIKSFAPDYLYMPLDQAPATFWQLAFPMPFRTAINQYSHSQSLDPFLVAALIRQESEFNVRVISHANAYGLMQVLPSTGRQLARSLGIKRFSAAQLLTPERNLQLGTLYFRNLLDSYAGQTELALASYNAGISRANLWRTWGPFRETPEFIEAVPFHETRTYVQVVLRNADVYQRLYSGTTPNLPEYHPKPPPAARVHPRKKRKPARPPTP